MRIAIARLVIELCSASLLARCAILALALMAAPLHAQENAPPPRDGQPATPAAKPAPAFAPFPEMPSETAARHAEAAALIQPGTFQPTDSEKIFLDRLMMAESGGRAEARNPRSTALGPYQFLASTFLDLVSRHFAAVMAGKTDAEILQLRTDHKVSRDAALVYTRENAAFLIERGHEPSAAHLRLAFLVGPSGATRVIAAQPNTPVGQLLGGAVLEANPFMNGMTAQELIQRSAREAAGLQLATLPMSRPKRGIIGGVRIRCNLGRASCRRWVALANKRLAGRNAAQQKAEAEPAPRRRRQ